MDFVKRIKVGRAVEKLESSRRMSADELRALKARIVAAGDAAIRPTIRRLGSANARQAAREILETLLSNSTLSLYIEALADATPTIVSGVSKILSASKAYDASRLLLELSNPAIPKGILEGILHEQASDIPPKSILPQLSGANRETRVLLLRLLDKAVDESMVSDLVPILDGDDFRERLMAIKLLSRFQNDEVVEGLMRLLKDENSKVRLECVKGLHKMSAGAAVPALVQRLRDPDLKVQSAAIDALVHLGDASTVPRLLEVLTDESEHARRGAVEVLNEIATADAIQDLLRALHDADWWVRVRAADALGTLGGERVVEAVMGLLGDSEEFIRRYAVEILNSVPHERAVAPLVQALQDVDWWVRERSIDALGNIGDARAVGPLLQLMGSDPQSTALCASALGKIGDAQAIEPLTALLESEREDVRREATRAIAALKSPQRPSASKAPAPPSLGAATRPSDGKPSSAERRPLLPDDAVREHELPKLRPASSGTKSASTMPTAPAQVPSAKGQDAAGDTLSIFPAMGSLNFANVPEGTVLLDRYRVVRKIGKGGFGSVYLAEDTAVQEELILKILNPQMSSDEGELRRFIQELKLTRKITDKHVIRIFDFLDFGGAHAVSMEYFPGRDLGKILSSEGALPPERMLKIVSQICLGLATAHGENVVHRDVKPANILVGADDNIKIVDFGLAWAQQRAGSRITKSGIMIGTPEYMAPELVRGDEDVDHRADIYSLGIMMYEMLAGQRPFIADTPVKVLFLHLEGQVEPLESLAPEIWPDLERLVARAMARSVAERPADVLELHGMIEKELQALHSSGRATHG